MDLEQPDRLETVDNRTDIVNFYKIRRQYDTIFPLLQYRRVSYPFERVTSIYNYFALGMERYNRSKREKLSNQLEPVSRDTNGLYQTRICFPFPLKGHDNGRRPTNPDDSIVPWGDSTITPTSQYSPSLLANSNSSSAINRDRSRTHLSGGDPLKAQSSGRVANVGGKTFSVKLPNNPRVLGSTNSGGITDMMNLLHTQVPFFTQY